MESDSYCPSQSYQEQNSSDTDLAFIVFNIISIIIYLSGISYITLIGYSIFFGILFCIINQKYSLITFKWAQLDFANEETIQKVYPIVYNWTNLFFDYLRYITTNPIAFYKTTAVLISIITLNQYISSWCILIISTNVYALYSTNSEKTKEMRAFISNISEYTVNVLVDSIPKYEEEMN